MAKGITWPGYEGPTVHFPGIPGIYGTGIVVSLESTGRTEDEMRGLIKGSPLKIVDLKESNKAKGGEDA